MGVCVLLGPFRRIIGCILTIAMLAALLPAFTAKASDNTEPFFDVPAKSYAYDAIHKLRELNITNGIGNNQFGYGKTITRADFVTFLVRLMGWELVYPEEGSFNDNKDKKKHYYPYIETALKAGIIKKAEYFRPNDNISREEIAIMIIRTIGLETLAQQPSLSYQPFSDVNKYNGYINIAKDLGIVTGIPGNLFAPKNNAKREEAAVMMMRMYEKLNHGINELHAFYAHNAYSQKEYIKSLDSVSFGWCRLEYDAENGKVILNSSSKNENDFVLPDGFSGVVEYARQEGASTQLNVFASNDIRINADETQKNIGLVEYIIKNPDVRKAVIHDIVQMLNSAKKGDEEAAFDGVVIDFEALGGKDNQVFLNTFLDELNTELDKHSKKLYVAVHPVQRPGEAYYNGYDFKTIGEIADKVILMAHDYNAKSLNDSEMDIGFTSTPLTPFDQIYFALKAITDKDTGVQDLSKIWLQISFGSAQWQKKDGKVINRYPYVPTYQKIRDRIKNLDNMQNVVVEYAKSYENPYITYYNPDTGVSNVIWYEDSRSVTAKVNLAKMFGIRGISLWRLGNIPDFDDDGMYLDVWQQLIEQ
ncbi:hypothetical protein CDQ84_07235 [Clostridium thermosuccinogenes]|uniref:Glycoside hydrolase n=1 Tax=Clostridium thermosuccinogenes TaxID=84032 RepID=A0A2K2FML1_9CLOT|nr:hypothetical protein CDO33_08935 [Pseudoclostridium thermosuccinogenes]PNT97986.1 hypothetical protein CDQ85_06735 [Pseudoclostridium thermosuccinogenes]PNU00006.1 hypothetical protein CDQ84_07235 [Pseudoclostridium thermosuccinogenes]